LEGLQTCTYHSTDLERQIAKENLELQRDAARAAAGMRKSFRSTAVFLENSEDCGEFAKAVLTSADFAEYIAEGLRTRTIPPTILLRLMDYADGWGKPTEKVEHTGDGAVVTEVRRVVVHNNQEDLKTDPTVEMQDEGLDTPLVPFPPQRMH